MFDLFCVLGDLRQPFLAGWLTCFAILEIWGNHLLALDWLILRFWRFEATISCHLIDLLFDFWDLRQPFPATWLTCSAILEIWGNHLLALDWLILQFWRFEATISCHLIDLFCDFGDLRQPFPAAWLTCSAFLEIWGNYFLPLDWLVLRFGRFEATISCYLIDLFCDLGDLRWFLDLLYLPFP